MHEALRLQVPNDRQYSAFHAGRISPEPYQFAPLARLLSGPRRSLLIADDVGLGKTIEAGYLFASKDFRDTISEIERLFALEG